MIAVDEEYPLGDIHPEDFATAVEARLRQILADSQRHGRNPTTRQEVQEDLFIASLIASWGEEMAKWEDWLRRDVINHAAERGGPAFLVKLGEALMRKKKRSRWFDQTDIFILRNWRWGHFLRFKTRAEAVKILRKPKPQLHKSLDHDMPLAQAFYASRIKRLGLSQGAKS
jgi:hypothetical protein